MALTCRSLLFQWFGVLHLNTSLFHQDINLEWKKFCEKNIRKYLIRCNSLVLMVL